MRLKSFTAKTMREAMDLVRDALGDDAVIVTTREEKDRAGDAFVQITAAVDKDVRKYDSDPLIDDSWLFNDAGEDTGVTEDITDAMLRHTLPEEVLDQIISCSSMLNINETRPALMSTLESLFKFAPLPILPESTPLMMIGAPGAGKTLACAKIAARSAMAGMNVAVITTDTERAGGREQLEAFTKLMDIDLQLAKSPDELKEIIHLDHVQTADQIIIDTAGANPFDQDNIKQLAPFIGVANTVPVFVMPANTHAEEAGEMADIFASIGAQRLFVSRVDVARRLGSLLSAAYHGGLAFSDISATPQVANGLSQLNSKKLTQLLMPRPQHINIRDASQQDLKKAS